MNARVDAAVWFNILVCLEQVHYRDAGWTPLVRRDYVN